MNENRSLSFSSQKKKNEPFRRVRTEEVEIDERIKDMSFEAKVSLCENLEGSHYQQMFASTKTIV